jgi:NDP-sugar pyrophosphorylase family protein
MNSVILAGGQGSRLGLDKNKSSLTFLSKTLLDHNLELLKKFSKKNIIVGGHYFEDLLKYQNDKTIELTSNNNGVVDAIKQGIEDSDSDCVILCFSDELVIDSNLQEMIEIFYKSSAIAVIGYCYRNLDNRSLIHNTFSIETLDNNRVIGIVEKPKKLINGKQGTSYAVLSKRILNYITQNTSNYPEIIQAAVVNNETVVAVEFCKEFFNNNTPEDLKRMNNFEKDILHNLSL